MHALSASKIAPSVGFSNFVPLAKVTLQRALHALQKRPVKHMGVYQHKVLDIDLVTETRLIAPLQTSNRQLRICRPASPPGALHSSRALKTDALS
jgi:hypothetical protein